MKISERTFLISFLLGSLFLFPAVSYGQEKDNLTNQVKANSPPVAQTLVPEGLLAIELVKALNIGQAQNEAEAESMLSAIGIEPQNGWIANYPVTPDIIGEIEKTVAAAADANRLAMGKEQAQKALEILVLQLGLNVMPDSSLPSAQAIPSGGMVNGKIYRYTDKDGAAHFTDRYENVPREYRDQIKMTREEPRPQVSLGAAEEAAETPANSNPEVVNNYYYNYGPPVVTYYEPPWPYYYMYTWVPYPFWCSRFFFSGFFILHDFHRQVIVNRQGFVVTNHVFNPRTRTIFLVDPVNRNFRGGVGPNKAPSPRLFSNPSAQASARAIVEISRQRAPSARATTEPEVRKGSSSTIRRRPQPRVDSNMPPAIVNRRTATHSSASGSSGMTSNPAEMVRQPVPREKKVSRTENIQKPTGAAAQRSTVEDRRSFGQPAPSAKLVTSPPVNRPNKDLPPPSANMKSPRVEQRESVESGRIFNPPPASQNRIIPGPAFQGRISSGESRIGMGDSLGRIFSRGR